METSTRTRRLSMGITVAAVGAMIAAAPAASARPHLVCSFVPGHTITRTLGFFYPPRTVTITLPGHRVCHIVR